MDAFPLGGSPLGAPHPQPLAQGAAQPPLLSLFDILALRCPSHIPQNLRDSDLRRGSVTLALPGCS